MLVHSDVKSCFHHCTSTLEGEAVG